MIILIIFHQIVIFKMLQLWLVIIWQKDLLITKYIEGSSNNKALEITNLTNHEVDLKNYYLRIQLKGSTYYFSDPMN